MDILPLLSDWSTTVALGAVFALLFLIMVTLGELILTGAPQFDQFTALFGLGSFCGFVGACRFNLWKSKK